MLDTGVRGHRDERGHLVGAKEAESTPEGFMEEGAALCCVLEDGQCVAQQGGAVWKALGVQKSRSQGGQRMLQEGWWSRRQMSLGGGWSKCDRALSVKLGSWDGGAMEGLGAREGAQKGT